MEQEDQADMIEGIVTVELHAGETVGYVVVKGNGCERVVAPRGPVIRRHLEAKCVDQTAETIYQNRKRSVEDVLADLERRMMALESRR